MDRSPESPAPPKLQLLLLGRFEVRAPDGEEITFSLRRARALLAYLLIERRTRHSRDQLANLLWGESQQQQARQSLRQLLSGLRKGLPDSVRSCLEIGGDTVGLDASRIAADVVEFEAAAAAGTMAGAAQAAALYSGSFLAGLDVETPAFAEWLLHHRERLQDMAVDSLSRVLAQQVENGKLDRAIVTGTRILSFDPLREETHRTLMEVYARQGQRSLAIRQYHRCADLLERELGVQPEPATKRLYMEVNRRERTFRPKEPVVEAAPSLDDDRRAQIRPHASASVDQEAVDQELIGKDLESAALREALAAAAAGHGSAVVITGEAGIGKSRLIRSVLASPGVAVDTLIAAAAELERNQPFGPWIELLRTGQLGEPISPDASLLVDYTLFEKVRAKAERSALVVVFEDLQWLDSASLEVLVYLANRLSTLPVVLVVSAREEELAHAAGARVFVDWLRQQRHTLRLALAPMPAGEVDALVARLCTKLGVPQPDEEAGAKIRHLSDGNPRVVEELVFGQRDAGSAAWRLSPSIPDKIAAASSARLDQLEPIARTAIDVAAVLGRTCAIATWQNLGAFDPTQAVHLLDLLAASQVIEVQGNEMRFRRERDRITAYERMPPAKRSQLHAQALEILRRRHAIDLRPHHMELLRHAAAANLNEDMAVHALGAAAFATQRGDWTGARQLAEAAQRAIQGMPSDQARQEIHADIDLCLSDIALIVDKSEPLDPLIERLKSHEQQATDADRQAHIALNIATLLDRQGRREEAILKARAAMRVTGSSSRHAPWTPGDRLLLRPHMLAGQFETSIERLTQSIEHARRIGDRRNEAIVLGTLGLCHAMTGRFADALRHCAAGRGVADALGNDSVLCACIQFEAQALAWRRDPAAVIRFDEALSVARRSGDLPRQYLALGHRGQALLLGGDSSAAVEALREALELGDRLHTDFLRPYFSAWLAEALVADGAPREATEESGRAARLATVANQPLAQSIALRALGVAMLKATPANPQEAERLLAAALAMQEGMQITIEVAWTLVLMSEAQRVRASPDAAQRSLDRGRLMFEQMGIDIPFLPEAPSENARGAPRASSRRGRGRQ